jgi:hypothetical protein
MPADKVHRMQEDCRVHIVLSAWVAHALKTAKQKAVKRKASLLDASKSIGILLWMSCSGSARSSGDSSGSADPVVLSARTGSRRWLALHPG